MIAIVSGTVSGYLPQTPYSKGKEQAREKAQIWQAGFPEHDYSYEEIAAFQEMFYRLGRRFGLLKEFRENGII